MLFISKSLKFFFVTILILSLSVLTFADTIRLKDGRVIKGKIVSFDGGRFTVMFDDGTRRRQTIYSADEVESIAFDSGAIETDTMKTSGTIPAATPNNENHTVITVGQVAKNTNPQTSSPKMRPTISTPAVSTPAVSTPAVSTPAVSTPAVSSADTSAATLKPITINVKVLADNTSNGWTNSGWVVRQGQRIKITGSGRISLGGSSSSTPAGIAVLPDNNKLIKNQPTGGLIAVIGDDNNDFIFVGDALEFVAARDGALFLGVNEGNLNDNTGAFDVKLEIFP